MELFGSLGVCHSTKMQMKRGATEFVKKLFKNVPVLDSGARGATVTFAERGIGDVLLTGKMKPIWPLKSSAAISSKSLRHRLVFLAEPPVAVVDSVVDKRGTRKVAEAIFSFLTDEAQDVIGKNFYRPSSEKFALKYAKQFPKLKLVTVDESFGGWAKAQKTILLMAAYSDQIYQVVR